MDDVPVGFIVDASGFPGVIVCQYGAANLIRIVTSRNTGAGAFNQLRRHVTWASNGKGWPIAGQVFVYLSAVVATGCAVIIVVEEE